MLSCANLSAGAQDFVCVCACVCLQRLAKSHLAALLAARCVFALAADQRWARPAPSAPLGRANSASATTAPRPPTVASADLFAVPCSRSLAARSPALRRPQQHSRCARRPHQPAPSALSPSVLCAPAPSAAQHSAGELREQRDHLLQGPAAPSGPRGAPPLKVELAPAPTPIVLLAPLATRRRPIAQWRSPRPLNAPSTSSRCWQTERRWR